MASYTVAQFVTPFSDKPIASPNQTIGQVLVATDSSHKPVYVFDGKKYLGLISAYQSIYHNVHAPHTKKVISDIKSSPLLTPSSSLYEALRAFMDTRLYELPVMDEQKNILGVITANRVLKKIITDKMISAFLIECLEYQDPIVRPHEGTVGDVFHLLKNKHVSRVILTDSKGKVNGMVSRSDIQVAFFRPSDRQRFKGPTEDPTGVFFDGEETYRESDPIERFSQTIVFAAPDTATKREVIRQLVESKYNSIVLVDMNNKPTGFLSIRDIIHCLATFEPDTTIPIVFQKPDDSVPDNLVDLASKKIEKTVKKLNKIMPIEKIDVALKEQKYSNQKVAEYETRIVISMKGTNVMASADSQDYLTSVKNALDQAEKQFIRNTKHTFHKVQSSVI